MQNKAGWILAALLLTALALGSCASTPQIAMSGNNLASSAAVSVTCYSSRWPDNAGGVTDGDEREAYVGEPEGFPQDVVLTWQEPQTFNTVVYKVWYGQSQGITAANILVSEDGEDWQEAASKKNMGYKANDETVEEHVFQFPVTTATALKLQVMNANLVWNQFAVNELYVTLEPTPGE